ncbi:MAG: hypothetical protein P4L50_00095 [Anaerolineaceae bacterium]|nr:hypothetical protein [Anaerolineaceae bacterium]
MTIATYNLAIKYCMANVRLHYSGEYGTAPAYKDLREVCTQFLRTGKGRSILALAAINQQRVERGLSNPRLDPAILREAKSIAREMIKNEIRKTGGRPSQYEAEYIRKAAEYLIKHDSSIIEQAKVSLTKAILN